MCLVLKEDLDKMLLAIKKYSDENEIFFVEDLEAKIKVYLADLKDAGQLSYCGCDGFFKVTTDPERDWIIVWIEIMNKVYVFEVGLDEGVAFYSTTTISSVIDDYLEIKENEFNGFKDIDWEGAKDWGVH